VKKINLIHLTCLLCLSYSAFSRSYYVSPPGNDNNTGTINAPFRTWQKAHDEVECFNIKSQKWSSLPRLNTGRHGTQAIVLNGKIYIAAGSASKGGEPEQSSVEVY
jgi:hypothetical protein